MKRNFLNSFLYISISLSLISLTLSCSDSLDVVPKDQISDATLWTDKDNADLFLNNIYGSINAPSGFDDSWENFSDNALNGVAGRYSQTVFAQGNYTPSDAPSLWGNYSSIRKTNLFVEKVAASNLPEDWKKLRIAESRFLRAYFYSQLFTYYGGVPIIKTTLNVGEQGDGIFYPRNSIEETLKFLVDELTEISNDLLVNPEKGRASKGASLALKGWCQLFAASPLINPDNAVQKWEDAAATYQEIIDMNKYKLFDDYGTLFLEDNNNNVEVIFDRPFYRNNGRTGIQGPAYVGKEYKGYGTSNPTQELVNEYLMSNGLPISDPKSGYNPEAPYKGREQRFYTDIIYDGSEWLGVEMVMRQGVGSRNATDLGDLTEATNTGYYWRKMMDPKYASVGNNQNSAHFIIYRYAEVLLAYAEAKNEASGPDQSVYNAVNEVRARTGLPDLAGGLSQAQMRKEIHRERRVELALEEKRWLDLTRLKLAKEKLNGPLHAVVIKQVNDKWIYSYVPAPGGLRAFHPEKNYWFPIPQSAIDRNTKLNQNEGYN